MKRRWTEEEKKFLTINYGTMMDEQIAEYLQRTPCAINNMAFKLRIKPYISRINQQVLDDIKSHLQGCDLSREELSEAIKIPYSSLYQPLQHLCSKNEVESYKRKDIAGLGRSKVIYSLRASNHIDKIDDLARG